MATFIPCSARASAIARPMRLAAPVTSAVLPARSFMHPPGLLLRCRRRVLRRRLGRRLRGTLVCRFRADWLLHPGLSTGGVTRVFLVGRDLLLGPQHLYGDFPCRLIHLK